MFLNFTNHPSGAWSQAQRQAAQVYGEIVDMPFPDVPPQLSAAQTAELATDAAARILALAPDCVLCQGEMTLTCEVVRLLQAAGVPVVAACSARCVTTRTDADGCTHRTAEFRFVQFRPYIRGVGDAAPYSAKEGELHG